MYGQNCKSVKCKLKQGRGVKTNNNSPNYMPYWNSEFETMLQIRKACCCYSLRHGSVVIGIGFLLASGVSNITSYCCLAPLLVRRITDMYLALAWSCKIRLQTSDRTKVVASFEAIFKEFQDKRKYVLLRTPGGLSNRYSPVDGGGPDSWMEAHRGETLGLGKQTRHTGIPNRHGFTQLCIHPILSHTT